METDSYNGENLVSTQAPPFLIGPSLLLRVTSTTKKSQTGLKLSKIQSGSAELAALERLNNPYRLKMGEGL